ncbi:MAG TPA: oligosaccharide flippase family protein [Verrucomicrobiae bacterium]|nr:oligosaccharide flippase family protein [Verrucomicrobiae bacterium]
MNPLSVQIGPVELKIFDIVESLVLAESAQTAPVSTEKHHITFFRQTGWMMMASTASGMIMYLVHPIVSRGMPESEYGVFTTLLQVGTMMTIPAGGLQPVIAQQQSRAITGEQQREVASEFRAVMQAMFFIWLVFAVITGIFWHQAVAGLKIQNPMALVMTLFIGLASLWSPLVQGMLQGRQNFLWLGWMTISNGVGRLAVVSIVVLVFHGWAAGAMGSVLAGMAALIVIGLWQARDVWSIAGTRVHWADWLSRVIPLTLAVGAGNFMLSADMVFTQKYFPGDKTGYYAAAGMIGRALVFLTQPLVMVMFPKLARASATGEKSNALALTLGTTVFFCGCAALGATILPRLPMRVMYPPAYLVAAQLVPWFAWCMLPLTLSQVMINSLMARARFRSVPFLVMVAVGYGFALSTVGRHCGGAADTMAGFRSMIQTIGVFNLLMFGVCAVFTWVIPGRDQRLD